MSTCDEPCTTSWTPPVCWRVWPVFFVLAAPWRLPTWSVRMAVLMPDNQHGLGKSQTAKEEA